MVDVVTNGLVGRVNGGRDVVGKGGMVRVGGGPTMIWIGAVIWVSSGARRGPVSQATDFAEVDIGQAIQHDRAMTERSTPASNPAVTGLVLLLTLVLLGGSNSG